MKTRWKVVAAQWRFFSLSHMMWELGNSGNMSLVTLLAYFLQRCWPCSVIISLHCWTPERESGFSKQPGSGLTHQGVKQWLSVNESLDGGNFLYQVWRYEPTGQKHTQLCGFGRNLEETKTSGKVVHDHPFKIHFPLNLPWFKLI